MIDAKPHADLYISNASEILTCAPGATDGVGRIRNGSIAIAGERILAVGTTAEIAQEIDVSTARVFDARGKIVAPGFVDCHTHLVFGGSRVQEYAARMTRDLAQLQMMGIPTGIQATVEMTQAETFEGLCASAARRLARMFRCGTTTVESKSGYGLTVEDELRMLRVNRSLLTIQPVDIVSTFLGAHSFPREGSRERYVNMIIDEMIPRVEEDKLAEFCDGYCEEGYFTVAETRRILEAARRAGLKLKIHADQYSAIGASRLAAEMRVTSADHLNHTDRASMHDLADANVVGVITPALDFAVQHPHPLDARSMIAEGMTLALATDLCPACWVESMQLVMAFACRLYRLAPEEALSAATIGSARALGLHDRGFLDRGKIADIQIWDLPTFENVIYRIGNNAVRAVIKRGKIYEFDQSE